MFRFFTATVYLKATSPLNSFLSWATMGSYRNILPLLLVGLIVVYGAVSNLPIGDPRRCMLESGDPKYRFEVLPGSGWDNLKNEELGRVVTYNYSKCRTTEDGRYLLPDGVYTIPLKRSKVETFAELITHWMNYTR